MKPEIDLFDEFYMNEIIINRKVPKNTLIYIIILILSICLLFIVSLFKYPKYVIYQGYVEERGDSIVIKTYVKNDENVFHDIKYLIYNNEKIKIEGINYGQDIIYENSNKYKEVNIKIERKVRDKTYIQFKLFKENTTLLKELYNRIRKDLVI